MATIEELSRDLSLFRNNPMGMYQEVINLVERNSNGETQVLSATTPFALSLEMMTALGTAAMSLHDTNIRKQFKSLSQNQSELYRHMADRDFINVYSSGAMGPFKLLLKVDTIRAKAVSIGSESNVKKLTIPKHSQFTVDNVTFCMQYPVDILVLPHNGISVEYGKSENSPIFDKYENKLVTRFINHNSSVYLEITIPCIQAKITSQTAQLNSAVTFRKTYAFNDKFLYLRAYIKNDEDETWDEIKVIQNYEIYDPDYPTIAITVDENTVQTYLPQIYFENNTIKDSIRLDIYTTLGEMSMVTSNYTLEAYSGIWLDLDKATTSKFSAPIQTMAVDIYSGETIIGGNNGVDFKTLKRQVVNGKRTDDEGIITPNHLENEFIDDGFDLVTNIDNITNRQYLATRVLPAPTNDSTITGVGCTIGILQQSIKQLLTNNHVKNTNNRTTIFPNVLYIKKDGIITPVSNTILDNLTNGVTFSLEGLVNHVNNEEYLYSPFTYVLESNIDYFNIRPYYLNNPKVKSVYNFDTNNEVGITAGIVGYNLSHDKDNSGYTLQVDIQGGNEFSNLDIENIALQLSYADNDNSGRVWIDSELVSKIDTKTGKPIDGIYSFRFNIDTNFDINSKHNLILSPSSVGIPLNPTFDLVLVIKDYLPINATMSNIDRIINYGTLPNYIYSSQYIGTHRFKMEVKLGQHLDFLWTRGRTIVQDHQYAKYDKDIYFVYDEDIPLRDENGQYILDIVDGVLVRKLKYKKGDKILDVNNQPTIKHYEGEIMLDPITKEKIIAVESDDLLREFELVLFDGLYYFANATPTLEYLTEAMDTILSWNNNNIPRLYSNLIDESDLKFHPKVTTGEVTLITDSGEEVTVSAYQNIIVTYYLSEEKYSNAELRKYIAEHTPTVINTAISKTTVAQNDIVDAIKAAMGDDILGVKIEGFMNNKYSIVTLKDAAQLPCIGKRLIVTGNLSLQVEDSITIVPIKHI